MADSSTEPTCRVAPLSAHPPSFRSDVGLNAEMLLDRVHAGRVADRAHHRTLLRIGMDAARERHRAVAHLHLNAFDFVGGAPLQRVFNHLAHPLHLDLRRTDHQLVRHAAYPAQIPHGAFGIVRAPAADPHRLRASPSRPRPWT